MFNEYMKHSKQCNSYYNVVRKEEIILQQADTVKFKPKWVEVNGNNTASTSTTNNNKPFNMFPSHYSANGNMNPQQVNNSNSNDVKLEHNQPFYQQSTNIRYQQQQPTYDYANYDAGNQSHTNSPAPDVSPTKQTPAQLNSLLQQQSPVYNNYQHNYVYQHEPQVPPQSQQTPSPVNTKLEPWTMSATNARSVQPPLESDTNGDFSTTASTIQQSILSEINIDELFMHYPNVFEEVIYSNAGPFKLNSIEQIENDLRTYCQQFKPFISTNVPATNATQQHSYSIRI